VSAAALGRPAGSVRNLSLAVAALVLIDPLLVRSIGFQLSVGASLAIGLLAERIATALPGPRPLAASLGVTLAAQVGVAPVLVPHFGGLPVVSLVTNVVSVPVAGLVTTWGLPAGLVAGVAGGDLARLAHLPTLVLVRWVALVARIGAGAPLGQVGAGHLVALVLLGTALVSARSTRLRATVLIAATAILLLPAVGLARPPALARFGGGVVLRSGGATVVTIERGAPLAEVLEGVRLAGVRRIDALVVDAPRPAVVSRALQHRWQIGRVIDARAGPPIHLQIGPYAVVVAPPATPIITGPDV
jgi:competence protein ComEC